MNELFLTPPPPLSPEDQPDNDTIFQEVLYNSAHLENWQSPYTPTEQRRIWFEADQQRTQEQLDELYEKAKTTAANIARGLYDSVNYAVT